MKKKLLISGGFGLLAREIERVNSKFEIILLSKQDMDVRNREQIREKINIHKPDIFIHCGAFTQPTKDHEKYPDKSIDVNIIGTSNVAIECYRRGIKLVYISTEWVYPNRLYNTEADELLPFTPYGWSKLGGECAAHILKDSLILRCSFAKRPYRFEKAFVDVYKSYLYVDESAKIILKTIEMGLSGVYNICGDTRIVYDFALESNPHVGKIKKDEVGSWIPEKCTMSNKKLNRAQRKWHKKDNNDE